MLSWCELWQPIQCDSHYAYMMVQVSPVGFPRPFQLPHINLLPNKLFALARSRSQIEIRCKFVGLKSEQVQTDIFHLPPLIFSQVNTTRFHAFLLLERFVFPPPILVIYFSFYLFIYLFCSFVKSVARS